MVSCRQRKYYYWLDWFRWLSAFIVVFDHCRCWVFEPYGNLAPESQGLFAKAFYTCSLMSHEAVMVFFILSGFLVGGRTVELLVEKQDVSIMSFLVNRMIRIWLPLSFALILVAISQLIMGRTPDVLNLMGNFFCINGLIGVKSELAILWTMPYIVWFYMLMASLILLCGKNSNKMQVCCGIVLLGGVLVIVTALTIKLFLVVTMGVLAFFLSKKQLPKSFFWFSVCFAFGLTLLTKFVRPSNAIDKSGLLLYFDLDTLKLLEGVVFAVIISQITNMVPTGRMLKFEQVAKHLAKFSYSMYLTHLIVVNMLVWMGMPQYDKFCAESLIVYVGVVALCIVFGYVSYLLVEKHSGKIKMLLN